jgi:putative nucleotidyltransferase with HDIG domain
MKSSLVSLRHISLNKSNQFVLMRQIIDTLSKMVGMYDLYTKKHQARTAGLARDIAKELKLSPEKINYIYLAALVHDIGKCRIPIEILTKPDKLTEVEYEIMKKHAEFGFEILKKIDLLQPISRIVLQHHERMNGSGYPFQLKKNEISLEARILGVADVVDAMTSRRHYRPALKVEDAIAEIRCHRSILYDPDVVDKCIFLIKSDQK